MTDASPHKSCLKCGRGSSDGFRRGLCRKCYERARRAGTLDEWPPIDRSSRKTVEEVIWLAAQGVPAAQWPVRLEMTTSAVERALYRAGHNRLANQVGRVRRQEASPWTT